MINYKYIKKSPDIQKNLKAITEFWKDNWLYQNELDWILIFYKKVTTQATRTQKLIEEEKLYFNENLVKGCCSYYKDIEELYSEWRKQRKSTWKFQVFNERSEKVTWNKISKFPKAIVEEMLKNAIQWSWGRLIDLTSAETEKIMQPIREKKKLEEKKLEWFVSPEDKQKAELRKKQIQDYINNNPWIRKEATLFVEEKHSNLEWVYKEKMITAKMASIANNNI